MHWPELGSQLKARLGNDLPSSLALVLTGLGSLRTVELRPRFPLTVGCRPCWVPCHLGLQLGSLFPKPKARETLLANQKAYLCNLIVELPFSPHCYFFWFRSEFLKGKRLHEAMSTKMRPSWRLHTKTPSCSLPQELWWLLDIFLIDFFLAVANQNWWLLFACRPTCSVILWFWLLLL